MTTKMLHMTQKKRTRNEKSQGLLLKEKMDFMGWSSFNYMILSKRTTAGADRPRSDRLISSLFPRGPMERLVGRHFLFRIPSLFPLTNAGLYLSFRHDQLSQPADTE